MPVYNAWSSDRKAKGKTIWSSGANCTEIIQTLNESLSKANCWFLCVKFVHLCVKGNTGSYRCTQEGRGFVIIPLPYTQGDFKRVECAFGQIHQGEAADWCFIKLWHQHNNIKTWAFFLCLCLCLCHGLPRFAPCKESKTVWILDSTPCIPDSLSMKLAFRIPMAGRIPDSLSCFLDSKAPDCGFLKQNFPDSTFLKQEFLGLRNLDSLKSGASLVH